jgi:hypothetical protein
MSFFSSGSPMAARKLERSSREFEPMNAESSFGLVSQCYAGCLPLGLSGDLILVGDYCAGPVPIPPRLSRQIGLQF